MFEDNYKEEQDSSDDSSAEFETEGRNTKRGYFNHQNHHH